MATQALKSQMESIVSTVTGVDPSIFNDFEFQVGVTPFTSLYIPFTVVVGYCIGIPLLQHYMKGREAPPLKYILIVHNVGLSVVSLFMAIFLITTLLNIKYTNDFNFYPEIFCSLNHQTQTGTLQFIYYINYLLKYYELLDTIFLALKGKKIGFLHAYHHPATLVLTWGQLVDSTGVQWVVILLNLFVHTVMYFYYAMAALKIKMPWKKIVTISQILQFVIDLIACYTAWAIHNFYGKCFGTNRAGIVGCFILTSYLYLFVDFYESTYNKNKNKNKAIKKPLKVDMIKMENKKDK